tara:strand:+ start:1854 stop:2090 length:237 start_codon:yes stop_codon:yes gene_type:complete
MEGVIYVRHVLITNTITKQKTPNKYMKKDVKMLSDVLETISKKRKQINFDSGAARQQIAGDVVNELRKRKCHINKIEL